MLTRGTLIYIGQRVLLIGFTLLVVSFGVFYAVHSLPGNAFVSEKLKGKWICCVPQVHEHDLNVHATDGGQLGDFRGTRLNLSWR